MIVWLGGVAVEDADGLGVLSAFDERVFDEASQLLPYGPPWPRERLTYVQRFARSLARTFGRLDFDLDQLRREIFVDTADESLEAWEEFAGLPGDCEDPPETIEGRRQALVAKLYRSRGPLSQERFDEIASELGYTVIDYKKTFLPFKMGSKMGAPMAGEAGGWQYSRKVIVSGSSSLDGTLRCIVSDAAHLHLAVYLEIIP